MDFCWSPHFRGFGERKKYITYKLKIVFGHCGNFRVKLSQTFENCTPIFGLCALHFLLKKMRKNHYQWLYMSWQHGFLSTVTFMSTICQDAFCLHTLYLQTVSTDIASTGTVPTDILYADIVSTDIVSTDIVSTDTSFCQLTSRLQTP